MSAAAPQVLIPIDFSDQSLLALDQSPRLAKFYNARLTLLYVIDDGNALNKVLKMKTIEPEVKKKIHEKLDELAATVSKKYGVEVNTVIAQGRVYDKILTQAEKIDAKLIIMGTNGAKKGLKKRFIGSNAFKVVRDAECPVITIKGQNIRKGCKNILLPIDLSKESREKVKNAIELGKLYGATIHVVSTLFVLDKASAAQLTIQVNHVKKFIEDAGVKCTTELVKAVKGKETLAESIIHYANKIDADLIILMTQQEGQRKPLFIGSTAQDIINNSDVPVMSIVPSVKRATNFSPY
jgi:nucleotide-binding universal stress UspA family protein